MFWISACYLHEFYALEGSHKLHKNRTLSCDSVAGTVFRLRAIYAGTVRGSNTGGGEIFRTCPDRPWCPPSLLYNGYRVFPGVKSGRSVTATPHTLLVPWSWKSRAIPLLPLWAVRPVQSLLACTRLHFTFTFTFTLDMQQIVICFPAGARVFSLHPSVNTVPGDPRQPPVHCVPGTFSAGVKWLEREAEPLPEYGGWKGVAFFLHALKCRSFNF